MTDRTRQELKQCIDYLESDGEDKAGAKAGLEDWFLASMIEDGLFAAQKGGDGPTTE